MKGGSAGRVEDGGDPAATGGSTARTSTAQTSAARTSAAPDQQSVERQPPEPQPQGPQPPGPQTAPSSGVAGAWRRRLARWARPAGGRVPGARPRRRFEARPGPEQSTGVSTGQEGQEGQASTEGTDSGTRQVVQARPVQTGFLFTVGVGLALLIYWIFSSNAHLLAWIAAALFIALGLDPVVRRLEKWGAPRGLGVALAVLSLAGVLAVVFSLLIPTVVEQTSQFVLSLPTLISNFLQSELFQDLDAQFDISDLALTELDRWVSDPANLTALFGGIFGVGTVIVSTGFSILIVLVLTLYFLVSLPAMKYWAYRLAPRSRRPRVQYLGDEITSSVGYYVIGQSVVAILNGCVAFIAVSIAGVPFGALLAFFAGLMAFIPLVGAMLGGITITLIALTGGWQQALVFALIYFAYLQVEAYFVSPRVMSKAVAVPGSVAVIAVIAGGSLLGVLGALLAIPTAASVMLLVREVLLPRQDQR